MNLQLALTIAFGIGQLLFLAGGLFWAFKQMRRDLSGMGIKLRALDERSDDRNLATSIAVILNTPKEHQRDTALIFLNSGKGKNR